jgi:putative sterol carrier protein
MAKLLSTELGKKIADFCLQCFGGYGYMEEYPIARMYRDARVGTIVGGTSEIMREIIAKIVIDEVQYDTAYSTPITTKKTKVSTTQSIKNEPMAASNTNHNNHSKNITNMEKPTIASDIIKSLPQRYRPEKAPADYATLMHFKIKGTNGGNFTVEIADGACSVTEGLYGTPKCIVSAKDSAYENVELGKSNPQMAVMMGKIKLSNISAMMTFSGLFRRLF